MSYPFENLDPESFQHFCQSLLVREHPRVQCFPVGQPDGGRDAILDFSSGESSSFLVYQIKFARNPAEKEPHKWLVDVLEREAPKVSKQIPEGATSFVLVTNVRGTAHPGVGSIDLAQQILKEHLPVPGQVWWRDDLERRLDNAPELKWAFPQLLTGGDVLMALVASGKTEDHERRRRTVRTFVSDQYSNDEEVKFKQVELQNRLLDLFVDVPISQPSGNSARRSPAPWHFYHAAMLSQSRYVRSEAEDSDPAVTPLHFDPSVERQTLGAATFLLESIIQRHCSNVVLEGGPGQGKSTITQYVAQAHRARLLDKADVLHVLPDAHRSAPVRLPIKVDLRDLATWLAGRDPFAPTSEGPPDDWQKSTESFIAALVRHHSGGARFSVTDLHAVLAGTPVLFLFDGLDEIADMARRQEVVEEVTRAVKRLSDIAASVQVVVTTRPTALARSVGFPEKKFTYVQLGDMPSKLIEEYAEKWLLARRLHGKEAADVRKILREKMAQPHLRDLARNPMQLAILLSLIHTRGASLPDKRTALYDNYIELFFNRESEKSVVVRDHRDLLIDIHRFLAWKLHSEAERNDSNGSIRSDELLETVRTYLETEEHGTAIADQLFRGMVERVVALVSRVEGTYEFEVQPLREYFAARYLNETAPYSPPGMERRGTKPDRLDAIAGNAYWFNVTRFFAGCFSKGELPSLVDRLQELVRRPGFSRIAYPRLLAATLLGDWVFAQHPRSVKEIVGLVLDGLGLRYAISSHRRRLQHGSIPLVLPSGNGREDLVKYCFDVLRTHPPADYASDVVDVLRSNGDGGELYGMWMAGVARDVSSNLLKWLEYGLNLGVLSKVDDEKLYEFLSSHTVDVAEIALLLLRARRWSFIEKHRDYYRKHPVDGIWS